MPSASTSASGSGSGLLPSVDEHHLHFNKQQFIDTLTASADKLASSSSSSGSRSKWLEVARSLDEQDPLREMRKHYLLPSMRDVKTATAAKHGRSAPTNGASEEKESGDSLYLCGNSLGPLPALAKQRVEEELQAWQTRGVLGHFSHPFGGSERAWATTADDRVRPYLADIVGARSREEVAVMGTLTQNIHNVLSTFYRPTTFPDPQGPISLLSSASSSTPANGSGAGAEKQQKRRHKIIYEWKAFPSDIYALDSLVRLQGLDPATSLVPLRPRADEGEATLRTADILAAIDEHGQAGETALIMLGGIQYFTGQFFDIKTITARARSYGIIVGWDLAHAFANVPLALHDWGVDFAVWCTYKYGSSGPGGIAGLFIHERWHGLPYESLPRPGGWYGQEKATRFAMPSEFTPEKGAAGFVVSNPSALDLAALAGSLETLAMAPKLLAAAASSSSSASLPEDFPANYTHASSHESKGEAAEPREGYIMPVLRRRSQRLTAFLEHLLLHEAFLPTDIGVSIVTPTDAHQRGSQLCIRIPNVSKQSQQQGEEQEKEQAGDEDDSKLPPPPIDGKTLIARAHARAERDFGLVADIRNPDILRMAPLAQFSTFQEVFRAAEAISKAIAAER